METERSDSVSDSANQQMSAAGILRRMSSASSDESGFNSDMSDDVNVQAVGAAASGNTATRHTCCFSSTHGSQREYVKAVARHLIAYIVTHMTKPHHTSAHTPCCSHAATMRRVVDELCSRHEITFESIARKLHVGVNGHVYPEVCQRTFSGVVDELFNDGQYNWGRIVTVVAFAGWWARSGVKKDNGRGEEWSDTIADVASTYMAEKLSDWICQQGGWVAMDEFFAEPEPLETKMWRGLLYTMVGLGVAATVAAAVR